MGKNEYKEIANGPRTIEVDGMDISLTEDGTFVYHGRIVMPECNDVMMKFAPSRIKEDGICFTCKNRFGGRFLTIFKRYEGDGIFRRNSDIEIGTVGDSERIEEMVNQFNHYTSIYKDERLHRCFNHDCAHCKGWVDSGDPKKVMPGYCDLDEIIICRDGHCVNDTSLDCSCFEDEEDEENVNCTGITCKN